MTFTINTHANNKTTQVASKHFAAKEPVKHYLIDTENLGRGWVEFLEEQKDAVYHIFYTPCSPTVSIECLEKLMAKRVKMEFIRCYTGSNALDFQLVTQLGYMAAQAPYDHYCIVSKDAGYNAVIKFWTDRGVKISRTAKPSSAIIDKNKSLQVLCYNAVVGIATEAEAHRIAEIIRSETATRHSDYKTRIHTRLVKEFSDQRAYTLYHACKQIAEHSYSTHILGLNIA